MFKKILLKLSGEALAGDIGDKNDKSEKLGFAPKVIDRIVDEIVEVKKAGTEVCLVVGGGNIWRGRDAQPFMNRARADAMGMTGTIINGMYLEEVFRSKGVKAVVMTPFVYGAVTELYSVAKANEYLEKGYVLIFSGGLGHPYFSTDTIAVVRACELECDAVLYAKVVKGVYDSDPNDNPNAVKFDNLTYDEVIEKDLKAIDLAAMVLCNERKMPSIAFDLNEKNSIIIASRNNDEIFEIGTRISFEKK